MTTGKDEVNFEDLIQFTIDTFQRHFAACQYVLLFLPHKLKYRDSLNFVGSCFHTSFLQGLEKEGWEQTAFLIHSSLPSRTAMILQKTAENVHFREDGIRHMLSRHLPHSPWSSNFDDDTGIELFADNTESETLIEGDVICFLRRTGVLLQYPILNVKSLAKYTKLLKATASYVKKQRAMGIESAY